MTVRTIDDIIFYLPAEPRAIDFAAVFGNGNPVELEIGSGKGGFLLQQAQAHPQRNFLGIEWASKYHRFAADRMVRWGVTNVRLLRADAADVATRYLAPAALAAVHVYHPDPWPKKRHHKRRLIRPAVVEGLVEALADAAVWAIQTDHAGYFEIIRGLLNGRPELEETFCVLENGSDGEAEMPVATNFQVKYQREGRRIYRSTYRRVPRPA